MEEDRRIALSGYLEDWAALGEQVNDLQEQIIELETKRAALEEKMDTLSVQQDKAAQGIKAVADQLDDTPENVAEVQSITAPYIARVVAKQVVS